MTAEAPPDSADQLSDGLKLQAKNEVTHTARAFLEAKIALSVDNGRQAKIKAMGAAPWHLSATTAVIGSQSTVKAM